MNRFKGPFHAAHYPLLWVALGFRGVVDRPRLLHGCPDLTGLMTLVDHTGLFRVASSLGLPLWWKCESGVLIIMGRLGF